MKYSLDVTKLAAQLLPPILRGKVIMALLKVLTLPLKYIHGLHAAHREEVDETLNTTANAVSLEAALNGAFFLTDGQISVETREEDLSAYWHLAAEEAAPVYLHSRESGETAAAYTMRTDGEGGYGANFTVRVPTFLCTSPTPAEDRYGGGNLAKIKEILSRHKPAGRSYTITLYDYE